MNATLPAPPPQSFLRALPRDITLREIARRNRSYQIEPAAVPQLLPSPDGNTCLCKSCRLALRRAGFRIGDQMWSCSNCGQARAWGCAEPENSKLRPALICRDCHCHTRHGFVGVIGRSL